MTQTTKLYDLRLHEKMEVENCTEITRVAGGWIYKYNGSYAPAVFVPFNDEFMLKGS